MTWTSRFADEPRLGTMAADLPEETRKLLGIDCPGCP